LPDITAIRRELETTTPYTPEEIAELLDNIVVDPAEVDRINALYFNRFGRESKQSYVGRRELATGKHVLLVRE
jgi:hypothetical protein